MLALKEGMTVIDGTLGGGGHSAEILRIIGKSGKLIGIDRDNDALEFCKKKFAGCESFLVTAVHLLKSYVDKIFLTDPGVNSFKRIYCSRTKLFR